jgi:superfamily I DNA and/or RNA helicase
MSKLTKAVLAILTTNPNQTAKELALECNSNKKSINQCLYFDLKDKVQINPYYQWSLVDIKISSAATKPAEGKDKDSEDTMDSPIIRTSNDNFAFDSLQSIRNRLLDLTGRNRLLNFRHGKTGFIRVIDEMPNQLAADILESKPYTFIPVEEPKREELIEYGYITIDEKGQEVRIKADPTAKEWAKVLGLNTSYELPLSYKTKDSKHTDSNIQSMLYPRELEAQLRNIRSKANTAIEEAGANILYLAFGFLEWFEDDNSDVVRQAPLYLIPVKVDRASLNKKTGTYTYTIEYTSEDIIPNLSLSEKLKHDFQIHLPELNEDILPEEYFKQVENNVFRNKPQWKIKRYSTLAMFDFGKLLMYLDLDPSRWPDGQSNIQNHDILQMFFAKEGKENTSTGSGFSVEYPIDKVEGVHEKYPLIDDADSSQHSALMDAIKGKNLVIEGPPGSGKSQTITNLIAAAISQGKKVLFVAEKMAALQVVKSRLERAGLGDFCLELHSHKTQKKQVYENIERRINKQDDYRYPHSISIDIGMYEEKKKALSEYANLINSEWKNTGRTIHQIFSAATRYREEFDSVSLDDIKPSQINGEKFDEISARRTIDSLRRYADVYQQVKAQLGLEAELSDHPWFGVYNTSIQLFECEEVCALVQNAIDNLNQLNAAITPFSEQIGEQNLGDIEVLKLLFIDAQTLPTVTGKEDPKALNLIHENESLDENLKSCLKDYSLSRRLHRHLISKFEASAFDEPSDLSAIIKAHISINKLCLDSDTQLSTLFQTVKKLNDLNSLYLALMDDISTLKEHQPKLAGNLTGDFKGFVDLNKFIKHFSGLDSVYVPRRNELFDNDLLDAHLPKLQEVLPELKRLHEALGLYFDLNTLPTVSELITIDESISEAGFFRWFDSDWRSARHELLAISNNSKHKFNKLTQHLQDLITYKGLLDELNREPMYLSLLQSEYNGINTPIEDIVVIRQWYKEVRASFGIGFGKKVPFATSLFESSNEIFKGIKHLSTSKTLQQLKSFSESHQNLGELLSHAIFNDHEIDFNDQVLGLDVLSQQLESNIKRLQSACKKDVTLVELGTDIQQIIEFKTLEQKLISQTILDDLFGNQVKLSARDDCERSERAIASTLVLNKAIKNLKSTQLKKYYLTCPTNEDSELLSKALTNIESQYQKYNQAFEIFSEKAKLDEPFWYDIDDTTVDSWIARNQRAVSQPRWLGTWVDFIRIRSALSDKGLEKLLRYTEAGAIGLDDLEKIYLYSVYDILAREIIKERQELAYFSGAEQNAIRKQFAEYDNKLKSLQQEKIAFEVAKNGMKKVVSGIASGKVNGYTEMGLINHEVNKKTRHAPVRQLIKRASKSLVELKPCFMMGPHSVAQYLAPGQIEFDIIVMDEASQIKPEDALGTIARGKQLVVVGDPKQLPPTSFFDKAIEIDDEDITAIEQSESILDVSLPMFNARRLRWHYRSRHESLIAFSNQKFYDSNLVVFPSPSNKSDEFGIKFTHVKLGRFVNQHNIEEAKVIAEAVRKHLLNRPDESLGVVAMSSKQREQIERCVEELSKDDEQFRDALAVNADVDEPLFLKNLENVQGDERDVIFISCTYGPQEAGAAQMPQRFGPINSAAGGRRLNVLFTRSKKRMHVFSSMTEGHILASDTSSDGVHALKSFLAYAQTGKLAQQIHTGKQPDSDFEISVLDALKLEGFTCIPQVGVAGYFIDLAVQDPGQPGRYLMGIECDGATYHSAKSARDRDRLRQSVLESLGWTINRIWSTDWFKNPQAQLKPIIELLHQLKTEVPEQYEAVQPDSEQDEIEQVIEQEEHQKQLIEDYCHNDDSLTDKLEKFEQAVISQSSNNIPLANRLLRPAMVAALCEFKPISKNEFLEVIPSYLRNTTASEQGVYLEQVLNIIADNEQELMTNNGGKLVVET